MHEPACSMTTYVRFAAEEDVYYRANASAVSLAFCGRGRSTRGKNCMWHIARCTFLVLVTRGSMSVGQNDLVVRDPTGYTIADPILVVVAGAVGGDVREAAEPRATTCRVLKPDLTLATLVVSERLDRQVHRTVRHHPRWRPLRPLDRHRHRHRCLSKVSNRRLRCSAPGIPVEAEHVASLRGREPL
jgi:hypothetical protein